MVSVAGAGTDHGHIVDFSAEFSQVVDARRPVGVAAEGQQRYLMAGGGQVLQDVVLANLGAGIEGIGDELGEVEEAHSIKHRNIHVGKNCGIRLK